MIRFFATRFSKLYIGLLISLVSIEGQCGNFLKINNIKDEESMPVAREQVPAKDRWNVEALYANPDSWKEDLKELQGQEKKPLPDSYSGPGYGCIIRYTLGEGK